MNTSQLQGEQSREMVCLKNSVKYPSERSWGYFVSSPVPSACLNYLPDTEVLCPSCELTPSPPEIQNVDGKWFESQFTLDCSAFIDVTNRPNQQIQGDGLLESASSPSPRQADYSVRSSSDNWHRNSANEIQSVACDINFSFRGQVMTKQHPKGSHESSLPSINSPLAVKSSSSDPDDPWTNISRVILRSESLESIIPSSQPSYEPLSLRRGSYLSEVPFSRRCRTSAPKTSPCKTYTCSAASSFGTDFSKSESCSSGRSSSRTNIHVSGATDEDGSQYDNNKGNKVLGLKQLNYSDPERPPLSPSHRQHATDSCPKEQTVDTGISHPKKRAHIKVLDHKDTKLPPGMTVEMMKKLQRAIPIRKKRKRRNPFVRAPLQCVLCHRIPPVAGETSRMCGHVCCKLCWREVTRMSRRCPECGALFSRKLTIRNLIG